MRIFTRSPFSPFNGAIVLKKEKKIKINLRKDKIIVQCKALEKEFSAQTKKDMCTTFTFSIEPLLTSETDHVYSSLEQKNQKE
jgi:hypothetical protein